MMNKSNSKGKISKITCWFFDTPCRYIVDLAVWQSDSHTLSNYEKKKSEIEIWPHFDIFS